MGVRSCPCPERGQDAAVRGAVWVGMGGVAVRGTEPEMERERGTQRFVQVRGYEHT